MAAGRIKGITIEIGGNTQPLEKALGNVNKKTRDLQGELKSVERLLKLDPGNTDLLAQKHKLLAEQVENSKDKLDALRKAQDQVNEAFKRGDINEEQYRHFSRQVINAEQDLKKFEKQLKDVGETSKKTGIDIQAMGDKFKNIGAGMTAAVTAPIVGAGAVMVKTMLDAEGAQAKLQAQLGLTTEEAEALGETAKWVWSEGFGDSIDDAMDAVSKVRRNIGELSHEELHAVATGAMTIAEVFDQDVNDVTRVAGVMIKNFGIDAETALDIMTVGFQQGGDYSGELLDTLREYAPQFASLGLSADQAMAMLIKGAEAGAWNLDKVGDAMKEFNIRAQDGSKTTAEGFAMLELNASDMADAIAAGGESAQSAFEATVVALAGMKDPVEQNIAGVALFGTQWEDVRSQVIIALKDGMAGLDDFEGKTKEATDAMVENNPAQALRRSMRQLQLTIEPALKPIADIITNTVIPAVQNMVIWFNELSPAGQKAALGILGIAAVLGPLLLVIGPVVAAVGGFIASIGAVAAAMAAGATGVAALSAGFPILGAVIGGLGTALSAIGTAIMAVVGFFGWWLIVIAAVIAAGVALYKNWDEIVAFASKMWEALKTGFAEGAKALQTAWANMGTDLKNAWQGLWDQVTGIYTGIRDTITTATSGFVQAMLDKWMEFKTTLEILWDNIADYFASIPSKAVQWGRDIISSLIDGFTSMDIPTPHFDASVTWADIAGVSFPIPNVDVDWYATGGIFTKPTLAGIGEAGAEAVIPLSKLKDYIGEISQPGAVAIDYDRLGRAVANALASTDIRASLTLGNRELTSINRGLQPIRQNEAARRGGQI